DGDQLFGKRYSGLVGRSRKEHVLELRGLRCKRGIQLRMRMSVNVDPPGGDTIEEAAPVIRVQIHAFSSNDRERLWRRFHLCVRMPETGAVAAREVRVFRHLKCRASVPAVSNSDVAHAPSVSAVSDVK